MMDMLFTKPSKRLWQMNEDCKENTHTKSSWAPQQNDGYPGARQGIF